MTEERIGGISVGIGGSLSDLEAVIAKAEAMVKESAERMGSVAGGYFSPSGRPSGSRGGGAGAGAASNEQLVHAINTLTQQLQQQKFGGGGARRGGQQSYEDALDEILTKHGNTPYGRAVAQAAGQQGGRMAGETRPAESFRPIPAVNANVREMRVQASSASLDVDMSSFTEMLGKATSGLTELAAALAHVPPTSTAASSGGGGSSRRARKASVVTGEDVGMGSSGPRRKNLKDRSVGTEVSPGLIYTFEPETDQEIARAEAAAANSRRLAAMEAERTGVRQREKMVRAVGSQLGRRMPRTLYDNPIPAPLAAAGAESYSDAPLRTQPVTDNDRIRPRLNTRMASASGPGGRRGTPPPVGGSVLGLSELDELFSSGEINRILGGQMARQIAAARIQRQGEAAQISREDEVLTQGRTARTGASSLAGFLFGGRRGETEAKGRLTVAEQDVQSATRYKSIFDRIILDKKIDADLGSKTAKQQMLAIQNSRVYKAAEDQVAEAEQKRAVALKDVEKFTQGALPAARNLAAITVGGAAFGLGLEAVNKVTEALIPALGNLVDIQTGFGATSTRVTTELGKQTLAFRGNAAEALANAEAQAGLSAAASDAINSQLMLTTQVKAGAQALQQSSELFRASYGAKNAPSGLTGGYGGLFGTGLLAQQMGGGMGASETIAQNIGAFRGNNQGPDLLGNLNSGLAYLTSADVRNTVNAAAKEQGNPLGVIGELPGGVMDSLTGMSNPSVKRLMSAYNSAKAQLASGGYLQSPTEKAYIGSLNDAASRGQTALGDSTKASYGYAKSADEVAKATAAAAAANDVYGVTMAQQYGIVLRYGNAIAATGDDYRKALEQVTVGQGIQSPDQMARAAKVAQQQGQIEYQAEAPARLAQVQYMQQYNRPAFMGQLTRTTAMQVGQVNPVSAYLENLANPPIAAGAGIALSSKDSAATQARVKAGIKAAESEQQTLNTYYEQGRQQIEQTYKPAILATFGQQGMQMFDGLLKQAQSVSTQIAAIETGVTQEQAGYATHQYENDLRIAKRSLTDILQLTGQIGASSGDNLGVYERQNLLLGRQAQQLQFMLTQRQINFQTAIAGFQVPGLTPAEQNARVEEAKIEASYAQKQLDIQKKMFGNQVKVVDIGNLRQATDLMHQIGLLQEGRKVTLDTAAAQAQLTRLQKQQAVIQKDISAYTSAVDSLSQKAISDIAEQEQAVGHAISAIEAQSIKAAYNVGHALFLGISGGVLGAGTATTSKGTQFGGPTSAHPAAAGFLGTTTGTSHMIVGEAGSETVAVLRNPRSAEIGGFGGGGGDIVINLTATLDGQVIYRDVVRRQGRDAALRGLRGVN